MFLREWAVRDVHLPPPLLRAAVIVGAVVGRTVGAFDGTLVGRFDGAVVGRFEGALDGALVEEAQTGHSKLQRRPALQPFQLLRTAAFPRRAREILS